MKIAEFFVDGFEQIEALTPVDILRRAGLTIDMISVNNSKMVTSSHNVNIETDKNLGEINFEDYDMLIFPGGPGTEKYLESELLIQNLKRYYENQKGYIAAICAAPMVLATLGILSGKRAASFPSVEEVLIKNGAKLTREKVVHDGRIITSRGAGTAIDFSLKLVEILNGHEEMEKISKSIIYEE